MGLFAMSLKMVKYFRIKFVDEAVIRTVTTALSWRKRIRGGSVVFIFLFLRHFGDHDLRNRREMNFLGGAVLAIGR